MLQQVKRISAPVCCFGPGGRPHFSLPSPSKTRGMARRQGAAWIAPGWNGLGVKRHAPRLAARQRGILAFMPLTVVGPGRLLVAGEAARVRPGDDGCVSPSLAGAAPVPRLQDASGRRPSYLDRDRLHISEFHYEVNCAESSSRTSDHG